MGSSDLVGVLATHSKCRFSREEVSFSQAKTCFHPSFTGSLISYLILSFHPSFMSAVNPSRGSKDPFLATSVLPKLFNPWSTKRHPAVEILWRSAKNFHRQQLRDWSVTFAGRVRQCTWERGSAAPTR